MPNGFDFYKWFELCIPKPSKRDKHVKGYVCCHKCGAYATLRKIGNKTIGYKYICNDCYKKELQNG